MPSSRTTAGILLVLLALTVTGCRTTPRPDAPAEPPSRPGIDVSELAARLGLVLERNDARGAVLRDGGNTVSVFPDPRGRVFVNGNPVGEPGGIAVAAGVLHVPPALMVDIQDALVPAGDPVEVPPRVASDAPTVPPPGERPPTLGTVVVDAGHGGKDPGTPKRTTSRVRGNGLIDEKAVNLDASLRLERLLKRAGAAVVLTRRRDVYLTLDERVAIGNRHRPRLFVSIHADAAENRSAHGFTVYVARRASASSLRAAALIRRELTRTGVSDRGIRRADYRVVKNARGPAVLVELGFLSNAAEARRLATSTHRERMAAALSRGILAFLKGS